VLSPTTSCFPASPPCVWAFSGAHPHSLALPRSVAPPVEHPRPLSLALCVRREARHGPPPVLWPSLSLCRTRCFGELRLFASNVGHLPVCPQPLRFVRSTLTDILPVQPKPRRRRPEASLCPCCCSSAPESPLEVSNPHALISRLLLCHPRNCSPEQVCATVGPLCRGLRPLVPLRRCRAHD
jgi:hypothetical protein